MAWQGSQNRCAKLHDLSPKNGVDIGCLRGHAGHAIILCVFSPIFFEKFVFLQQLYCFQYNRAVGTTPYGKRHPSRTKHLKPLQSILEER